VDDISAVRLKTSDKSLITKELAKGDGTARYFKLGHAPILLSPALQVRVNGALLSSGYSVDLINAIITFDVAPLVTDQIEFTYYWSIFTDDEIQYFLDDNSGNTTIAAAKVLLAIAADASKVAQRQSMAGGGGLGSVTLDTSVTARELRNTAQALIQMEVQIGESVPADGLTEVAWGEQTYHDMIEQQIIRRDHV